MHVFYFFFFKQKTAYEMRISDWSSDVCSSDLTDINSVRVELVEAPLFPLASRKRKNGPSTGSGRADVGMDHFRQKGVANGERRGRVGRDAAERTQGDSGFVARHRLRMV